MRNKIYDKCTYLIPYSIIKDKTECYNLLEENLHYLAEFSKDIYDKTNVALFIQDAVKSMLKININMSKKIILIYIDKLQYPAIIIAGIIIKGIVSYKRKITKDLLIIMPGSKITMPVGFSSKKIAFISDNIIIKKNFSSQLENLTYLVLPDNIEEIQDNFCYRNKNLIFVKLPKNLKKIGEFFMNICSNLTTLDLPNSIIKIGSYFCTKCYKLDNIKLPETLEIVEDGFLDSNIALKHIIIPNSVSEIGKDFMRCSYIKTLKISENINKIGVGFCCNSSITKIEMIGLKDVLTINSNFCSDAHDLKSVVIDAEITNIGDEFCYECTNLKSVFIPNARNIGSDFCSKCRELEEINITNIIIMPKNFCILCQKIETIYNKYGLIFKFENKLLVSKSM